MEDGAVRQEAGPPEWFKPKTRSHSRSTRRSASRASSAQWSSSDSDSDDARPGKVSYREWMKPSHAKTDGTGHRLIWGYETIPEEIVHLTTPLAAREKVLKDKEKEERRKRRRARKEEERSERKKARKKKKESEDKHAGEDDDDGHKQKYDLKAAAKAAREDQKSGAVHNTVEGKSILLNVLQTTLHTNRVKDGEQIDKARVMLRQAGFDEGGRKDVKLLSAYLNTDALKPRARSPSREPDPVEAVPNPSYDEFKQKKQEEKVQERKAKIKAKIKEQKAKAKAYLKAKEQQDTAQKAVAHHRVDSQATGPALDDAEISLSVDALLASVAASLEAKAQSASSVPVLVLPALDSQVVILPLPSSSSSSSSSSSPTSTDLSPAQILSNNFARAPSLPLPPLPPLAYRGPKLTEDDPD